MELVLLPGRLSVAVVDGVNAVLDRELSARFRKQLDRTQSLFRRWALAGGLHSQSCVTHAVQLLGDVEGKAGLVATKGITPTCPARRVENREYVQ